MANVETMKKVSYIGVWLEDVFTDQVVQNIAAYAKASKGKKVKISLSAGGLRFKKSKWFQEKLTEYYPLASIKSVAKNPVFAICVMFILADSKKKYRIVAIKCPSEAEAIHLVTMYSQIRRDGDLANMELKKRDNGNWTLRERSAANANRHLAEIFSEREQNEKSAEPANGDIANHVPVLDKGAVKTMETTTKPNYIKRNAAVANNNNHYRNNNNVQPKETTGYIIRDDSGDDYVIETEVSQYPATTGGTQTPGVYISQPNGQAPPNEPEVAAFRSDLDHLSSEVRDIKVLLNNMNTNDSPDARIQALPSKPIVHKTTTTQPQYATPYQPQYANIPNGQRPPAEPVVYRAAPRTYEATVVSSRRYNSNHDPWASHRRHSGTFLLPAQLDRHMQPGTRVQFDTESVRSGVSTKSKSSKKIKLPGYTTPTTLERPIEEAYGRQHYVRTSTRERSKDDAYGRQQFVRRHSSSHNLGRPRPVSVHVVGKNELAIYQPHDRYMDIAL